MDDHWENEVTEYGAVNITGFRIIDLSRKTVRDFMDGLRRMDPRFKGTVSVCMPFIDLTFNKCSKCIFYPITRRVVFLGYSLIIYSLSLFLKSNRNKVEIKSRYLDFLIIQIAIPHVRICYL